MKKIFLGIWCLAVTAGMGMLVLHDVRMDRHLGSLKQAQLQRDTIQGALIQDLKTTIESLKSEILGLTRLHDAINDIRARMVVPTLDGIILVKLESRFAKAVPYQIDLSIDVNEVMSLDERIDWQAAGEDHLPFPWPDNYVKDFKQSFNPFTFAQNATFIAKQKTAGNVASDVVLPYLLQSLAAHTDSTGQAAFVRYDFDYPIFGNIINKGWHSSFGNAAIVTGLCNLYAATNDHHYLSLAKSYVQGLSEMRSGEGKIAIIDESDYLWFEEYPALEGRPTHVLNGHAYSVFALYRYLQVSGDEGARPLIQAGLTTLLRYMPEARRPGEVSKYGLYSPSVPDYGPRRMVNFLLLAGRISREAKFNEIAQEFATDAPLSR